MWPRTRDAAAPATRHREHARVYARRHTGAFGALWRPHNTAVQDWAFVWPRGQGTIKGITVDELKMPELDCKIILGNTYHLGNRPGGETMAAMGGLDAVVFTAGISENNSWLVDRIKKDLAPCLPAGAKFIVVPTNEELLIARDTFRIIKRKRGR